MKNTIKSKLVITTNNAYNMCLLVRNDEVVGAWEISDEVQRHIDDARKNPETIDLWEATNVDPDCLTPEAYGEIIEEIR